MKIFIITLLLSVSSIGYSNPISQVTSGSVIEASKLNEVIAKLNALEIENEALKQKLSPIGSVIIMAGACPVGYMPTDGASLLRSEYPELFSVIGTAHGTMSGLHFNLPDYRGRFLRGVDGSAGNDVDKNARTAMALGGAVGNNVGSIQLDENKAHTHTLQKSGSALTDGPGAHPAPAVIGSYTTSSSGGSESRPKNAYVNYCIKFSN